MERKDPRVRRPRRSGWTSAFLAIVAAALISTPHRPQAQQPPSRDDRPDYDVRDSHPAVLPRAPLDTDRRQTGRGPGRTRANLDSGSIRVVESPDFPPVRSSSNAALRTLLMDSAERLGLERADLSGLIAVRDYTSRSNGVRHVYFRQFVDGHPVFDSAIGVHVAPDGTIVRITSNAAPVGGRRGVAAVTQQDAALAAAAHTGAAAPASAALVWLPVDGALRLAWHSTVAADPDEGVYDVLIDAATGDLLVRRNRVRREDGTGRILQSSTAPAFDLRRPDPMPFGSDGTLGCPPPVNHVLQDLATQFRDPATVLGGTGRLAGNNAVTFRGSTSVQAAAGTFDGARWLFDFPFNSAGAAETSLFFAMNFAHDFFYELGFDEAAGNFQLDNFGRGGLEGDPVRAVARSSGRNNANYVHAPDGSSPTINMFLWDATGCWGDDVDGDGTADLDGDFDFDIILHEYHHGVSLRLNTSWTGNEAGAMGEGGGDFFAYSVNGDELLAEYARPGGLRQINAKGYGDWTCLLGLICSVHENGQIWANVLWDVRERLRTDLAGGSEPAAIHESHQLYVDALTLSPPAPTMLDMRDAMLQADALRNPSGDSSANFCRLWESFAGRGMGVSATDTADNGFNRVGPAYDVPAGCTAPPAPPVVTVAASAASAFEAGAVAGEITVHRDSAADRSLTVTFTVGGTATSAADYVPLETSATIPAGASSATIAVTPIDDAIVERDETVTITLRPAGAYTVGAPSTAAVSIVSDDLAPDLSVSALAVPEKGGAGSAIRVTDTTRNVGTGASPPSSTSFYLSLNAVLGSDDRLLGSRAVGEIAAGASDSGATDLTLPHALEAGTYFVLAKADGPGALFELNELNNTRGDAIAVGPDLVVSTVTVPAAAGAGTTIVVSDTTVNQGAGAAPASSTRFHLSVNGLLDGDDRPLQARSLGALAAGAASTGSTSITLPSDVLPGSYYLIAQADAASAAGEANESNNLRSAVLRIGPDLSISSLSVPSRGAAGGLLAVSDTTRNGGGGPAGASATAFYLSTNLTLDAGDRRLAPARTVAPLAAGAASSGTTSLSVPETVAPGVWYLLAHADDLNGVAETLETNNVRYGSVRIGPDLMLYAVSVPSTAAAGSTITVSNGVRNGGAGEAGPSTVRYYLSTNYTLDAGDVRLEAGRPVPALAGEAVNSGTAAVPLPAGTTGSFYLLVVADGDQAVAEANELNNVAARVLRITGGE